MFRKHSGNAQEMFRKHPGNAPEILRTCYYSGNIGETSGRRGNRETWKPKKNRKKKKTESSPPLLNKKHDTLRSAGDARKFKTSAQNARTRLTETNSVKSPQFRTRWTNFRPGGFKIFAKAPRWLITNTSLALKHYEVALSDSRSKLRRSRFLIRGLSYADSILVFVFVLFGRLVRCVVQFLFGNWHRIRKPNWFS